MKLDTQATVRRAKPRDDKKMANRDGDGIVVSVRKWREGGAKEGRNMSPELLQGALAAGGAVAHNVPDFWF
jgi:hypothetical protein